MTILGKDAEEKQALLAMHDDHHDKRHYIEKIGAFFASGFLAGAEIGEFDVKDMYHCLEHEEKARHIFYEADMEIKKSFHEKNAEYGIKGLDTMVYYIFDMATETWEDKRGHKHPKCPVLDCPKLAHWDTYKTIVHELKNKETTLRFSHHHHLKFNNDVIDE